MNNVVSLDAAARAFLAAALRVLQSENVLPRPVFNQFLRGGRDYIVDSITCLREFAAFEDAIADCHPRFRQETSHLNRDSTYGYALSFVEAFVAEATLNGEDLSSESPSVETCLNSLTSEIRTDSWEVACCREVSNLTTVTGEALNVLDVTVIPVVAPRGDQAQQAVGIISQVIPHSQSCYERTSLGEWDHPHSIIVARGDADGSFNFASVLSDRIDLFMLAARLLHGGSCDSLSEVQGETTLVRRSAPAFKRFRGASSPFSLTTALRRTTRLEPLDSRRFRGLAESIAAAEQETPGMFVTSFRVATNKFQSSYHAHSWDEQLVDLVTAFEAALSGTATTDVVLRIKTRAAALLSTKHDSAREIFHDVGILYGLRSKLIHGGALTENRLISRVKSITTVPDDEVGGLAVAYAVDRLRDLVRRALLARIALAACEPPLWELEQDDGVDAQLADAPTRARWRSVWRDVLGSFDASSSIDRPQGEFDFTSRFAR